MPTDCGGDQQTGGGQQVGRRQPRLRALRERLVSCKPVQRFLDWYGQFWGDDDEEERRLHEADADDGFVNWFCLPFFVTRRPRGAKNVEAALGGGPDAVLRSFAAAAK
ncbi:uncharacterized protein LOC125947814 [Dermacentor silvarum]|uniref:uncharacterized protein LOC125947814 n=1 Tax=Dermacentor silvarum TaxID=543639 RepID=UPI002100E01B|nr:uncharacterized protein LOC125947814 [Dermacentor silvarum]